MYYEGFVKIFDEGYSKTLYINVMFPHKDDKLFFMGTKGNEAWVPILVKALAKYCGSYDALRTMSIDRLSTALFGMKPFKIGTSFSKVYKPKTFELKDRKPDLGE
mgnify:CR=1 FL=1